MKTKSIFLALVISLVVSFTSISQSLNKYEIVLLQKVNDIHFLYGKGIAKQTYLSGYFDAAKELKTGLLNKLDTLSHIRTEVKDYVQSLLNKSDVFDQNIEEYYPENGKMCLIAIKYASIKSFEIDDYIVGKKTFVAKKN